MAEVSSKTTALDGGKKKGEGGDGPLLVMLLMGIAIVPLTLRGHVPFVTNGGSIN